MKIRILLLVMAFLSALALASPVLAHDAFITTDLTGIGDSNAKTNNHTDADPWKGWVYLTVTNHSGIRWGDFHFKIFSFDPAYPDVSQVDFLVDPAPQSSQTLGTVAVDNSPASGATMDLYFYGDPVEVNDLATFFVYTDNRASHANFGVMFWATPVVPEPSSLAAMVSGLAGFAGLLWRRRRL